MRGVDDEGVDTCLNEQRGALVGLFTSADTSGNKQTAVRVLRRVRVLLALHEVLHRDQANQLACLVHDRQLLHLVRRQQRKCLLLIDAFIRNDQRHRCHHLCDLAVVVRLEAHIAVGDDAHQALVGVDHRQARDVETAAQRVDVTNRHVRCGGHRVGDHAGLRTLYDVNLLRLVLSAQVAVQHANATLARHRDRHPRLRDRIHRSRCDRDTQLDVAAELRARAHFGRHNVRLGWQQQHIIKGQAPQCNLVRVIPTCKNSLVCH